MNDTNDIMDCSQNACPICTSEWNGPEPCTGVIGASQQVQTGGVDMHTSFDGTNKLWKTGNANYTQSTATTNSKFRTKDLLQNCYNSKNNTMGMYDKNGVCIPATTTPFTNLKVKQTNPLIMNSLTFNNFNKKDASTFQLQALHKIWGDGGTAKYNRGVSAQNVYVSPATEVVSCSMGGKPRTDTQKVLVMEAHGDNYTGTVPGITKKKGTSTHPNLPVCPIWEELPQTDTNYNKRVGGVACTRDQYGPGIYNILAYVPKTEDMKDDNDGRGYVFAIWPYNYAEIYTEQKGTVFPPQYMKSECTGMCDSKPPPTSPPACPSKDTCTVDDTFTVINHEIDIEIPCNSSQLKWKTGMTWDTMNCNTWLTDTGNYNPDTGGYYTQVAVKKKAGSSHTTFISDVKEDDTTTPKDYHWYTLDWHVENDTPENNYVAFYFDDPFDPSGTATFAEQPLPKQPTGKGLVHKTGRFVPTRAGRLNIGPWMAWWGYGGFDGGTPKFDTAKVRMAHLSIIPIGQYGKPGGYSFPQSYDQPGIECDFVDLYSKGPAGGTPTPGVTPTPGGAPGGAPGQNLLWLWILLSVLVVLGIGVLIFMYSKKKNKSKRRKK